MSLWCSVKTYRDDDVAPDPGFDFGCYSAWVAGLNLHVSQPLVSANGHFEGSGLSVSDWPRSVTEGVRLYFDLARVLIVEQMAPGKRKMIRLIISHAHCLKLLIAHSFDFIVIICKCFRLTFGQVAFGHVLDKMRHIQQVSRRIYSR